MKARSDDASGLRTFARLLLWSSLLWFFLSLAGKGYAVLFFASVFPGWILLGVDKSRRAAKRAPSSKRKALPSPKPTLLNHRYEVVKPLKTGGMAEITLATDRQTSSYVIVKTPRNDTQHDPKINVDKLTAEAAWLRQITHPHIVGFIDLFTQKDTLYLVVEYIEGEDLLSAFASAPAEESRVIKWAEQILSALEYIHASGYVHRDLNPGNVMLRAKDDNVIIIDFGTVKPRAVHGGTVVTKPGFEVPEAALGYTDERSDLFCVGGTLFYLLTCTTPGSIGKQNVVDVLVKKSISEHTAKCIEQALQINAERRFHSAQAMKQALCGRRRPPPKLPAPSPPVLKRSGPKKTKPPPAPTILNNRYEVLKPLKKGGMAEITLATDRQTGLHVIVKTPRYDTQHDPKINEDKLIVERDYLKQFNHPHIVKFVDFFTDNNKHHLVVEYIKGADLLSAFAKAPAEESRVIKWAEQILSALAHIHNLGVVHRDLNPGNIMLRAKDDNVVIIDFGTIKACAVGQGTRIMKAGFVVPEQAAQGYADQKSDLFGVGGTLFYLLTSTLPDSIGKQTVFDVLVNKGISEHTARCIEQALRLDANRRFGNAVAMKNALCRRT